MTELENGEASRIKTTEEFNTFIQGPGDPVLIQEMTSDRGKVYKVEFYQKETSLKIDKIEGIEGWVAIPKILFTNISSPAFREEFIRRFIANTVDKVIEANEGVKGLFSQLNYKEYDQVIMLVRDIE